MNSESAALVRLALSRERLRQALSEISRPHAEHSNAERTDAPAQSPAVELMLDAVRTVWAKRPLGRALDTTAQLGRAALRPVAQRHPWGLVLGAALAGGLLAASRPWRLPFKPAIVVAWLPQLLLWTLAQMPTQPDPLAPTSRPAAVPARTA